ncbi:MAG: DNA repair protein RecO [Gemmatimonadales bacterium]
MTTVLTPAIVLSTMRYGETSKIARLATRDLGIQSAIAKGASRPRSRFGAALHLCSEGIAHIIPARRSDLHTLAAFEITALRVGLAARMDRFATASLLAEIMLQFAPAAAHEPSFDLLRDALAALEIAPEAAIEPLGLRMLWQLVSVLGFEPAVHCCARDGAPLPDETPLRFSAADGGLLCPSCATGHQGPVLVPADQADLRAFATPGAELPALDERHFAAHRRLFSRYLQYHLGEGRALPALEFWEQRAWVPR